MKYFKTLLISLALSCSVFAACGAEKPASGSEDAEEAVSTDSAAGSESAVDTESTVSGESTEAEETGGEVSAERAMDNFLAKVDAGNYTIDDGSFLKTSVYSKDLVWFDYADDAYNDFAVMSVNGEAFQAFLTEGGLADVRFLGEEQAVDAARARLLNYWTYETVSQGNIFNLFYNSMEDPLTFVSYDDTVKQSLLSFAGYGENALRLMHEVYMVLDAEDPTAVRLQAEIDEDQVARIFYDDIDVAVNFGSAEANPEAEAWMSAPAYPEARTEWTDEDIFIFNSVFLPGYGESAVPFTPFASYAFTIDEENFVADDEVRIRDSHATQEDMEDYTALLLENGFSEAAETDEEGNEKTCYRKLLREEFDCYSSIELSYDGGVNMTAKKYYEFPVYNDLDAINERIAPFGYPPLAASSDFGSVSGTDVANEMTESWLYFFNYDLGLYVDLAFDDYDKALSYVSDYEEAVAGAYFSPVYIGDDDEIDRYESENGFYSFRYRIEDDNTVRFLYKVEKYVSSDEAEALILEAGFPGIDLEAPITFRDLKLFEKTQFGREFKTYYTVSQTFEEVQEAEAFLTAYEAALNDAGFDRVSPSEAETNKQIAIYNEESDMLVALDFTEQNGGALVNFEFRAE